MHDADTRPAGLRDKIPVPIQTRVRAATPPIRSLTPGLKPLPLAKNRLQMRNLHRDFLAAGHRLENLGFEQGAVVFEKTLVGFAQRGFALAEGRGQGGCIFLPEAAPTPEHRAQRLEDPALAALGILNAKILQDARQSSRAHCRSEEVLRRLMVWNPLNGGSAAHRAGSLHRGYLMGTVGLIAMPIMQETLESGAEIGAQSTLLRIGPGKGVEAQEFG